MRRRVALAAGLGGLAVLTVLMVVLAQQVEQRTGTNAIVSVSGVQVTVPASRTRCQPANVPAGTQRITVFGAARRGGGPLLIVLRGQAGVIARARIPAFPAEKAYTVALRPAVTDEIARGELCFDNNGARNLALAGNLTSPVEASNTNLKFRDDVRTDFSRAGSSARIGLAPDVARRFPLGKSAALGSWTLWAVLVVILAVAGVSVRLLLREARA